MIISKKINDTENRNKTTDKNKSCFLKINKTEKVLNQSEKKYKNYQYQE